MPQFQTLIHPTDFDEPSKEAFRLAQSLAQALGAQLVVFHVVPPPAIVADEGKIILDPQHPNPIDLWAEYRTLHANTTVPVQYAVVVGEESRATRLLEEKIRGMGEGVLVVMGTHARTGLRRLFWGSKAEEVVRNCPCPVLVVKTPSPQAPAPTEAALTTASA